MPKNNIGRAKPCRKKITIPQQRPAAMTPREWGRLHLRICKKIIQEVARHGR